MKDKLRDFFSGTTLAQTISYFVMSIVLIGLLHVFGQNIDAINTPALAIIWALASVILAIGFAYPAIIKKKNTKEMFLDGSRSSRIINGRGVRLAICYLFSAFLCATLLVESIKWTDVEWFFVCAAIPIFFVASLAANHISKSEYKQPYQRRGRFLYSRITVGIILTIFFTIITFLCHFNDDLSLGETFSTTPLFFSSSSSVLLQEIGKLNYLIDGYTTYMLSHVEPSIYLLVSLILCASSAFALSFLFSFCLLRPSDFKEVFRPIEEFSNKKMRRSVACGAICSLAFCFVLSIVAFSFVNSWATETKNTEPYSAAEAFVRELTKITTYQIDENKYDSDTIDNELNKIFQGNSDYTQNRDDLIQTYSSAYDTCEDNVDAYLDWFYRSFPEDPFGRSFQYLEQFFDQEKANERAFDEYYNRLTLRIDLGKIETDANAYNQMIWSAKDQLQNQLSVSPIYNIPPWLIYEEKSFDDYFQSRCVNPTLQLSFPKDEDPDREAFKQAILDSLQKDRESVIKTLKLNQ